jgi:VWFA-related protein
VHTSPCVAAIAVTLGLSAWSAAQPAAPPPRPSPTTSQPEQTTEAPPSATQATQAQRDQPVYRGGVELIQLDVSVLDRKRQPVTGLNASDFTVFENGLQRPVSAFTSIQLPARRPDAGGALPATVPVNVVTNQVGQQEGRLVIILMDRTIPTGQPTIAARKIATAAVEALAPHDLAALVSTSGAVPQNLTTDRSRLIHAINEPRDWSTGHSKELKDVMTIADDPLRLNDGRCLCGLCVLETLTNIADAVQNTPRRRKVLLFIGSSVIVQAPLRAPSADVGCDKLVTDARRRLFDSLALSNLTVHSIDPSGLTTLGPQTRAGTPGGRQGIDGPGSRLLGMQTEISELLREQGTLQVLPNLTGGRAIANTNAPAEKVSEIFGETDAYYIVGFQPVTPDKRDDKRSIEVKVARSGVGVYTQRQYIARAAEKSVVARGADASLSLEKSLRGLLPNASRPLTLSVAAFAGSEKANAIVMVNVDVGAFANASEAAMPLEFAVSAMNQKTGRQVAFARETATITFKPGTSSRRAEANVQTEIKLTAGDYEVRVAVSDPARGIAASVFCPVTVPLFASATLSLSDVIVETTNRMAALRTSAIPVPTITTRRVFEQDESVRALMQVYQGTQRTDVIVPVSVRTSILDANGHAIRDQLIALTVKDFANRRAALALDIGQLPHGDYVLSLDASLGRQTTSRILAFAVQ